MFLLTKFFINTLIALLILVINSECCSPGGGQKGSQAEDKQCSSSLRVDTLSNPTRTLLIKSEFFPNQLVTNIIELRSSIGSIKYALIDTNADRINEFAEFGVFLKRINISSPLCLAKSSAIIFVSRRVSNTNFISLYDNDWNFKFEIVVQEPIISMDYDELQNRLYAASSQSLFVYSLESSQSGSLILKSVGVNSKTTDSIIKIRAFSGGNLFVMNKNTIFKVDRETLIFNFYRAVPSSFCDSFRNFECDCKGDIIFTCSSGGFGYIQLNSQPSKFGSGISSSLGGVMFLDSKNRLFVSQAGLLNIYAKF